jgi:hypothetical protein
LKTIDPNTDYFLIAPVQYIGEPNTLDDCDRFIIKWGINIFVSSETKG